MKLTPLLSGFLIAAVSCAPSAFARNPGEHFTQKQIDEMVSTAVHLQLEADKNDHSVFLYHDHDVQPKKNQYAIVVQTASHGTIHRITRVNGKAIPLSRQKAKVEDFVHSPELQQEQHRNNEHDARQVAQLLQMIPSAFRWSVRSETPNEITLSYVPNPSFHPPNKEDHVFAAMAGEMVLDRQQHRIVAFKGKLIRNVDFFFGLIGHMDKGGTFSVQRRQVEPNEWETVSMRTHIHGHVLLFKTISQDEDDYDTDFTKAPPDMTLKQAAKLAMQQPDWPSTPASESNKPPGSGSNASKSH